MANIDQSPITQPALDDALVIDIDPAGQELLDVEDLPKNPELEFFKNLVKGMSKEDRTRISEEILDGFRRDQDSLSELEKHRLKYNKLFDMQSDVKAFPWHRASNVKLPVTTKACINFQARASINLFSGGNIVKSIPIDNSPQSMAQGKRVARHMNWQIQHDMPNFFESFDDTLMQLPKDGYAFRKTFWDSTQKKVVSESILPQDLIVNYFTKDIEKSARYSHILHMTENEIRIKGDIGTYENADEISSPTNVEVDNTTREAKERAGQTEEAADFTTPREVLEVHTWLDLKGKGEIREPFVVTIDKESREIFRIIRRENPLTGLPITYFTNYTFLPNPNSIFAYGFGTLLLGINESMNTSINQLIDAGTLQNVKGGWVLKGSAMARGDMSFKMGEFKQLNARTDDIRKAIFPLEFSPPSQTLMQLVQFLKGYSEELTTVTEIFSGSAPKSDTTATGASLAIEQGAKIFTGIQQRIHRALSKELNKIKILNGIFLDANQYLNIVTEDQDIESQQLINPREDYLTPLSIIPVSDPNIVSDQQNVAKAEFLNNAIASNPFLAQDPEALKIGLRQRLEAVNESESVINQLIQQMDNVIQQQEQQAEQQQQVQQSLGQNDLQQIDAQIAQAESETQELEAQG